MITRTLTVSLVLLAIGFAGIAQADDDFAKKKKSGGKRAKQAVAIFDKIKSLSGDWISTKGEK